MKPEPEGVWWCNAHQRQATHRDREGRMKCDPKHGGILLPCRVVFAEVELVAEEEDKK